MIKVEFKINFSTKLLEYIKFPCVNIAQERKSKKSILLHSTHYGQTYDTTFHDIYSKATFITHLFAIINNSSEILYQESKNARNYVSFF